MSLRGETRVWKERWDVEGDVGCDEEVADFEERLRSEEVVACTGVTLAKRSRLAANREKSTLATSLTSSFCISIKQAAASNV